MTSRPSTLPRRWFFTDSRLGDAVWAAIARLPKDVGVIVRVPSLARDAALARRLIAACRRRGLTVLLAGPVSAALRFGADGAHLPERDARRGRCRRRAGNCRPGAGFRLTAAAHSRPALLRAERLGVDGVFLSPIFPTRSHPDARTLGPARFGLMTRGVNVPVLALGGMTPATLKRLAPLRPHGWGAIDAWVG